MLKSNIRIAVSEGPRPLRVVATREGNGSPSHVVPPFHTDGDQEGLVTPLPVPSHNRRRVMRVLFILIYLFLLSGCKVLDWLYDIPIYFMLNP